MIVIVTALTYPVVVLQNLAIEVKSWKEVPQIDIKLQPNTDLEKITKIYQGGGETIIFDASGENLYASNINGAITKYNLNTKISSTFIQLSRPQGMAFDKQGNLIVCDSVEGLLSISPSKETKVLVKEVDRKPVKFANDVDVSSNGEIYFTDSTNMVMKNDSGSFDTWYIARIAVIASLDTGRLIKYDPETQQAKKILGGLVFANGVALSQNEDFILVVETGKYRLMRHWLKGAKAGTTDVFVDNLPGFPDGVRKGSKGTFWVAIPTLRNDFLDKSHPSKTSKEMILMAPRFLLPKTVSVAIVLHLDENGKIIGSHQDLKGGFLKVSQATEHNGKLYLGSISEDFIGVYELP